MTPLAQLYLGLTLVVLILAATGIALMVVWDRETIRIRREAFERGLAAGSRDGMRVGHLIGYQRGYRRGHAAGWQEGADDIANDRLATAAAELEAAS